MKIPPFIISASVLFWGWQTGLLPFAACIVPIIELERFIKIRWDFSDKDFNRISDLCTLTLGGLMVYLLVNNPTGIIHYTVKWLPLIVFPVLAGQLYSVKGKIDIRSIMLFARKNKIRRLRDIKKIDVSYPYIITCVISAGIGNHRGNIFYIIVSIMTVWALFPLRSKRYSPFLWAAIISFTAFTGYYAHVGLHRMQEVITEFTINYYMRNDVDPFNNTTAIGKIGKLKLSNKILMRVENQQNDTILLREASYNAYRNAQWYATLSGFTNIDEKIDTASWIINKSKRPAKLNHITIYSHLKGDKKILKIPGSTYALESLNINQLEKNSLGTVRILKGEGFSVCKALYAGKSSGDRLPDSFDEELPQSEKDHLDKFIAEINAFFKTDITTKTPAEKLDALKKYFYINFSYSLTQKEKKKKISDIENFLFHTKKGHCEFYATTTVLLLRALNIPARYTTGYLVHEYSTFENMYIVRQRDAHAWVRAYIDGNWQNYDTTPPGWPEYETENASKTPFKDFFSILAFKFSRWRYEMTQEELSRLTAWIFIPLGIFLLYRLRSKDRIKRRHKARPPAMKKQEDKITGLYSVEEKLKIMGYDRYQWETFAMWFERIQKSSVLTDKSSDINAILQLHYKEKYSDKAMTELEKLNFNSMTEALIETLMAS